MNSTLSKFHFPQKATNGLKSVSIAEIQRNICYILFAQVEGFLLSQTAATKKSCSDYAIVLDVEMSRLNSF